MDKQVDKKHYNFKKYCFSERWFSYWQQLVEVLDLQPQSVLEIGVGDNVFGDYLKHNTQVEYRSADITEELHPDFITSIDNLQIDEKFDVVCAFEVLEHLPWEKFQLCLEQLFKVSHKYAVISVPHWGRHFSFSLQIPGLPKIRWQFKLNWFPIKHKFNGQHYWEIGKSGYSIELIRKKIKESGWQIKKDYVVFDSPYHHFFVLEK